MNLAVCEVIPMIGTRNFRVAWKFGHVVARLPVSDAISRNSQDGSEPFRGYLHLYDEIGEVM